MCYLWLKHAKEQQIRIKFWVSPDEPVWVKDIRQMQMVDPLINQTARYA